MNVTVVGAGLSGLVAARRLAMAGHAVTVFDKGRSPGGRLATRRIGAATVDHGAQFFTVRGEALARAVGQWRREGLVVEWNRGFGARPDGHPRYRVDGGMNALAKRLAEGLDVRCEALVFSLHRSGTGWSVQLDDGSRHGADAVVLTCPVPQSLSLAISADVEPPAALRGFDYDPTLGLLAVLDGPSAVPAPGGVQDADETFSFVADNAQKGISAIPALTLHARAEWSEARLHAEVETVQAELLAAAAPWIGESRVVESQVKRWRYATPRRTWPEPCLPLAGSLVFAGDAFAGPRVEGAYQSGLAAAAALLS